jgi:hypothetical protein
MKINSIRCNKCKEIIYSRSPHDFKTCSCGSISIDGGQEHIYRIIGEDYTLGCLEIDITLKELYDDWNKMTNNYGCVDSLMEEYKSFKEQ